MEKWEYLIIKRENGENDIKERINNAGNNGWELVSVIDSVMYQQFFFKKMREEK